VTFLRFPSRMRVQARTLALSLSESYAGNLLRTRFRFFRLVNRRLNRTPLYEEYARSGRGVPIGNANSGKRYFPGATVYYACFARINARRGKKREMMIQTIDAHR